jgi:hypothetical protein
MMLDDGEMKTTSCKTNGTPGAASMISLFQTRLLCQNPPRLIAAAEALKNREEKSSSSVLGLC